MPPMVFKSLIFGPVNGFCLLLSIKRLQLDAVWKLGDWRRFLNIDHHSPKVAVGLEAVILKQLDRRLVVVVNTHLHGYPCVFRHPSKYLPGTLLGPLDQVASDPPTFESGGHVAEYPWVHGNLGSVPNFNRSDEIALDCLDQTNIGSRIKTRRFPICFCPFQRCFAFSNHRVRVIVDKLDYAFHVIECCGL